MEQKIEKELAEVLQKLSMEQKKGLCMMFNASNKEAAPQPTTPGVMYAKYDESEIMRLIGMQAMSACSESAVKGIGEILKAYSKDAQKEINIAIDIFLYGYIEGKRAERQKKKATAKPTTVKQ